jgi:hypothetical protein
VPAAEYQVFLVPERQVRTTRGDGSFVFADVPPGVYSIVARETSAASRTVRGPLNRFQPGDSLALSGARLDYGVLDGPQAGGAAETPARTTVAEAPRP